MSDPSVEPVTRLVAAAHEAAGSHARWGGMLAQLATEVGATGASLFTPRSSTETRPVLGAWGTVTEQTTRDYFSTWIHQDPWNQSPRASALFARSGALAHGHQFVDDRSLQRTDYWDRFGRHAGGGRLLCLKVVGDAQPGLPETNLTLSRRLSKPAFDRRTEELLRAAWPGLQRAVRVHHALSFVQRTQAWSEAALDSLPQPSWLLRPDGALEHANRAAHALNRTPGTWRLRGRGLVGLGDLAQPALLAALHQARSTRASVELGACLPDGRRGVLRVAPLYPDSPFLISWPRVGALAMLEPHTATPRPEWLVALGRRYGLTGAEQDILVRLAGGETVRSIAAARRCSTVTVRTHLRALFDKTGARRQAELVRLVAQG